MKNSNPQKSIAALVCLMIVLTGAVFVATVEAATLSRATFVVR